MSFVGILALALLTLFSFAVGTGTNSTAQFFAVVFFVCAIALYFSPTGIAHLRGHPNRMAVLVLNVLLGWTVLGWVAALVWAYSGERSPSPKVAKPDVDPLRRDFERPWPEPSLTGAAPQAVPQPGEKVCPFCAETVKAAAIKCRFCGEQLPPKTS